MLADSDLAVVGRSPGDSHRAQFVLALLGGEELAAGDLAARAGTSSSLASARGKALQRARTCYDHLAGQLGVALTDAFEQRRLIAAADSGWSLTSGGERRLSALGVDRADLHHGRRPVLRPCLDWTERRPHMAGTLGQVIAARLMTLEWVRRAPASRALLITPLGERQLLAEFAVRI